jgi:hypothetical protein
MIVATTRAEDSVRSCVIYGHISPSESGNVSYG